MIKPNNVLFYFVSGSKTFCTNATDEDLVGVRYEVENGQIDMMESMSFIGHLTPLGNC